MLSDADFIRYSRQIMLPECGEAGIEKLKATTIVIVGCGGLGQIVAPYLAAAGIGCIDLIDHDNIEVSNLPRQWLYPADSVGQFKARRLKQQLHMLDSRCLINAVEQQLTQSNVVKLTAKADLILDCSDNMPTRQLINRTAYKLNIKLISAAAIGMNTQVLALNPTQPGCYYCLYPYADLPTGNCQSQGVLGPVVGMAASHQASLALQAILSPEQVKWQRLWRFNASSGSSDWLQIISGPHCPICQHIQHQEQSHHEN